MNTIRKRTICILLVAIMLLITFQTSIFAAEGDPFRVESTAERYATLEAAIAAAESVDTITVRTDAEITATVTIPSGSQITLTGEAGVCLSRGEGCTGSMLSVPSGATLTVCDLTLDGNCGNFEPDFENVYEAYDGYIAIPLIRGENFSETSASGSIINSTGVLTLNDVVLKNGAGVDGGAVYAGGGSFKAEGTAFEHNLSSHRGGALFASNCEFECVNTSFTDNFSYNPVNDSTYRGGAVSVNNVTDAAFSFCTFTDNTSSMFNGGAVSARDCGKVSFADCDFYGNICGNDGYAVEIHGATNSLYERCDFVKNTALADKTGQAIGVVSIAAGSGAEMHKFSNCNFIQNYGILVGDHNDFTTILFEECSFIENDRGELACIALLYSSSTTFKSCSFSKNTGPISFYASDDRCKAHFEGCEFDSHLETAIFFYSLPTRTVAGISSALIDDCSFTNNTISTSGIVRVDKYWDAEIRNSVFRGNSYIDIGDIPAVLSVLLAYGESTNSATENGPILRVNGCDISSNKSTGYTGIYALYADLSLSDVEIYDNVAETGSMAGVGVAYSTATIENTKIYNNTAEKTGGGMGLDTSTVTFGDGVEIYNNYAGGQGADIFFGFSKLNLPEVGEGLVLDECGHTIDGWYIDSKNSRWSETNAVEVEPGNYENTIYFLKAAHSVLPEASMTYATTFSYTEPWSLLFAAALKLDGELIDTAEYTNYGAYILKSDKSIPADELTTEYMIKNGKNYSKDLGKWEDSYVFNGTKRVRLTYDEQLYTYQLDQHIYVMFYIEYDGQTYYGTVKDRQEKTILEAIANTGSAGNTAFTETEIKLVTKILELYQATQEYLNSIA